MPVSDPVKRSFSPRPWASASLSTAIKASVADEAAIAAAVASMTRLNAEAARLAVAAGVTGGTDVTGFGLLGHLGRAAIESGIDVTLDVESIPILPTVRGLIADGVVPGGTRRNLANVEEQLDRGGHGDDSVLVVADAQTSGGLIVGVDPDAASAMVAELVASGHAAAIVGSVVAGTGRIRLR